MGTFNITDRQIAKGGRHQGGKIINPYEAEVDKAKSALKAEKRMPMKRKSSTQKRTVRKKRKTASKQGPPGQLDKQTKWREA